MCNSQIHNVHKFSHKIVQDIFLSALYFLHHFLQ